LPTESAPSFTLYSAHSPSPKGNGEIEGPGSTPTVCGPVADAPAPRPKMAISKTPAPNVEPPEYIGFIFPLILSFQAAAAGKEPCASVGSRSRSPPASARAEIGKRAGACRIVAGLQNPPFVASAAQLRPAARHSPPIHRSSGGPNRSAPR